MFSFLVSGKFRKGKWENTSDTINDGEADEVE